MKRVAPIALVTVCLGTPVLDSNCCEPLRWLFGAGEYGAGVRTLLWGLHPPGIPCWGVRQRDGFFDAGCWRWSGLDALSCWFGRVSVVCVAVRPQDLGFYGATRPVLKHGPRSLTCVRVLGWQTPTRREIERRDGFSPHLRLHLIFCEMSSKSIYVGTRKMVNYACAG